MSKTKDLTGHKFGRLTAIKIIGRDKKNCNIWECLCECGNTTKGISYKLIRGSKKS